MVSMRQAAEWQLPCILLAMLLRLTDSKVQNSEIAEILHRPMRALTFPDSSNTGLFIALAVPLEEPYKSISVAYFFEANYALPSNTSLGPYAEELGRGGKKRRSIDRATIYQILESKLDSAGFQGYDCLLRAICETSEHPLRHNGLIGDVMHILFTPTSSRQEELPDDILQAELLGRNGSCSTYKPECPVGLFDLIGVFA